MNMSHYDLTVGMLIKLRPRAGFSYALRTIQELWKLSLNEFNRTIFVFIIVEENMFYVEYIKKRLEDAFPLKIKYPNVHIMVPNLASYPDSLIYRPCHLKALLNDPLPRVMWRSKLAWELTLAMEYSTNLSPLYLHLEDDTIPMDSNNWRRDIFNLIEEAKKEDKNWTIIRTWPDYNSYKNSKLILEPIGRKLGGALGILYKRKDMPPLINYLKERFDWEPVDWLIGQYFNDNNATLLKPKRSLFKHIGEASTKERVFIEGGKKRKKSLSTTYENDFISIKSWEQCKKYGH